MCNEIEKYYICIEKKTGYIAKGTKYGGPSTIRKGKSPPKLYTIGSAKSLQTQKAKFGIILEIIPVELHFI